MINVTYLFAIIIAILSIITLTPTIFSIGIYLIITIASSVFGIVIAIWIHIKLSSQHTTGAGIERVLQNLSDYRSILMNQPEYDKTPKHQVQRFPVIFGRTVDSLVHQLLDNFLRDYVNVWLKQYAYKSDKLIDQLKEDIWGGIQNLHDRASRIDHTKLIAVDMITRITFHFEKIRIEQTIGIEKNKPPVFSLSPHLLSSDKELEYLRKLSEMLIMFLLPRGYSLSPAKYLLREILACKVFLPTINCITEPDYINQKIVNYIESQKASAELHRSYELIGSFEDFIRHIHGTTDIEILKNLRYELVTEIMKATTIQNLKRAKGVNPDMNKNSNIPGGVGKADVLAAKKLKRYIGQLTIAKMQCEKRLTSLGWNGGFSIADNNDGILNLNTILDNLIGRKYLTLFLETMASQDLVGYWSAVEELRIAHRSQWHQLGAEIFYTFIRSPTAEIKVDKLTRKRMESFLLGDKGPEVFFEVQQTVFQTIEQKYYQPFVISSYYKQMIEAMNAENNSSDQDLQLSLEERTSLDGEANSNTDVTNTIHVGDHSTYAKRKLCQLQEKLNNKMQALQALRTSLKPESKVLAFLEREVEWLQGEKRQLEAHITRTEVWSENLGKWRAVVQSAEIPDEKEPPQFVIVVHMEEDGNNGEEGISSGWVVLRTLAHFQELHRKLRPLCSGVKNLELPSNSFKLLSFGKFDHSSLIKAKYQIQKYLEFILADDRLNQSEALYSFLSPSSDHLKYSTPSPKKSKFSFATLFKSGSGDSSQTRTDISGSSSGHHNINNDDEDTIISQCLDAPGASDIDQMSSNRVNNYGGTRFGIDSDNKDQIAEPLYALMGEIFDMRGVFKFLRRSLITFVQITYGRTISRQIREIITWCFCESMLHYYLTLFIKSWWPGGELAANDSIRTREQKIETAITARKMFVNNVPEVLTNLVGTQTAKRGALKVFEIVQNPRMNKQLFYDLLEILLKEVFSELKHQ